MLGLVPPKGTPSQADQRLNDIAKVIKEFENQSIEEEKKLRFSVDSPDDYQRKLIRDRYEQRMRNGFFQSVEAVQDSMRTLKEAMLMAMPDGTRIEDIKALENPYIGENRLSSTNAAETEAFANTLFADLLKAVAKLAKNTQQRKELTDYMMAKHGLERNKVMAEREAQKLFDQSDGSKTLEELTAALREKDYSGLTALTEKETTKQAEQAAAAMVAKYERDHDTTELWDKTRAVSHAILSKLHESGMMGNETYKEIMGMYKNYIPLRGFAETTAEDEYTYLKNDRLSTFVPFRKAQGRTSMADDPLAYLSAMAESPLTIVI